MIKCDSGRDGFELHIPRFICNQTVVGSVCRDKEHTTQQTDEI